MTSSELPARFAPERPFPAYAFVPGRHPHPVTDPQGHSFGRGDEAVSCPDLESLERHPEFLYALDLFNHGYYWEAHEAWEGFWHAFGRRGETADYLKGLIHLAAAGVKAREGNRRGVEKHAARAKELFTKTGCPSLREIAASVGNDLPTDAAPSREGRAALAIRLTPEICAQR